MTTNLKPCPECGGEPFFSDHLVVCSNEECPVGWMALSTWQALPRHDDPKAPPRVWVALGSGAVFASVPGHCSESAGTWRTVIGAPLPPPFEDYERLAKELAQARAVSKAAGQVADDLHAEVERLNGVIEAQHETIDGMMREDSPGECRGCVAWERAFELMRDGCQ